MAVADYQSDINLNAAVMDKQEIEKVNDIIKRIDNATDLNNLISEGEAIKYVEAKVPPAKNYTAIKKKRDNKKAQLDQDTANQKNRIQAIQVVKDY